jgi:general secretion pathway protein D
MTHACNSRFFGLVVLGLGATAGLAPALAASPADPPAIPATPAIANATDPTIALDAPVRSTIVAGTTTMPVVARPARKPPQKGDISLNFPAADVAAVARAVLGDLLHRNYVIAQGVTGPVTLKTPYPVSKAALFALFEDALHDSGLALVAVAGGLEIQQSASARSAVAAEDSGSGSEVIQVRFINTDEIRKVLDQVLPGVVTSTSAPTGTITIAGTTGQRAGARDIIKQFDVDWLRNTSFALFTPHRTDARLIVPSLDKLINAPDSPTHGLVRLITMDQLNGILAISTQPAYLHDIQRWVEILDREGESSEPRIFVYRVQNGRARDLTRTINAAYGITTGDSGGAGSASDPFGEHQQATGGMPGAPAQAPRAAAVPGAAPGGAANGQAASGSPQARVTADEGNNAVIVFGTPREYAVVEDALRKLDVPPQQILIEAAITEVGLTDNTSYGVQWNYTSGATNVGYSTTGTASGGIGIPTPAASLPGFSYFYSGSSISATLNALQQHMNIKVVSAPKLLVLNNQTAALQVGDEVPISSGTTTNLSNTNSVTSTIEYKDTGVILKITPRVNASGLVQLDVSQEVSQVSTAAANTATEEQSPTISTRRIATTVAVRDGQVIALGGLFLTNKTTSRNGIPILSQIPVVGALFGTHTTTEARTELIVLLKPHVLSTDDDARAVTTELRAKLRTLEPFRSTGAIP